MRTQLVMTSSEAKKALSEVEFDMATGRKVSVIGTGTFDSRFISQKLRTFLRDRRQFRFVME